MTVFGWGWPPLTPRPKKGGLVFLRILTSSPLLFVFGFGFAFWFGNIAWVQICTKKGCWQRVNELK